jgi:hypothetical protein
VLSVEDAEGTPVGRSGERHGTTPSSWVATVVLRGDAPFRARLVRAGEDDACATLGATDDAPVRVSGGAWPVARAWDRDAEMLYSAWIEHLFDDPLDAEPSWHGLDPILADAERNLLYDYLDLGEDEPGLGLEPDCADLPYFLRAYFAWKLELPFGYSTCSRGGGPPRCSAWRSNQEPLPGASSDPGTRFGVFVRGQVADTVHSGSGRTAGNDDRTDFYPTELAVETIRPGAVYADPYGHTLIAVQRIPQTADAPGMLLAVDAQPDGTIARKRYWEGTFLFADDPALGGPGFKHFRPVVRSSGGLRPLSNGEVAADPDYGDFSLAQYEGTTEDFYDRMDSVLSPTPMDPARVLESTLEALDEQIRTRIESVANGETYVARHPGTIAMPRGGAIFQTTGPWEDYATPSRDLRLLIAIDVVRDFPARVARKPERYAIATATPLGAVRDQLDAIIRDEATARRFTYQRSDGSDWTVTLAEVLERGEALEVAYNPNDCVETRWGAPEGSPEAATCRRQAPSEQRRRMEEYRPWFHERRRPVAE